MGNRWIEGLECFEQSYGEFLFKVLKILLCESGVTDQFQRLLPDNAEFEVSERDGISAIPRLVHTTWLVAHLFC